MTICSNKEAWLFPGQVSIDTNYYAVKLTSIDSSNTLAQFTTGTILTGGTSGVTVEITKTAATDGTLIDTIFVKYSKTGTNNTADVFSDGETLTGTNSDSVSLSVLLIQLLEFVAVYKQVYIT